MVTGAVILMPVMGVLVDWAFWIIFDYATVIDVASQGRDFCADHPGGVPHRKQQILHHL